MEIINIDTSLRIKRIGWEDYELISSLKIVKWWQLKKR